MDTLSKSDMCELFEKTCHHPDLMVTLVDRGQVVYRIFNDMQKKPITEILREIMISDFLEQMQAKKCQLQIYLDLEEGVWKLVEYTFLTGAEFVPQFLEHIQKIEHVKDVYKIVVMGSEKSISNLQIGSESKTSDIERCPKEKKLMVKLWNALKKKTRFNDFQFEFDTNKHHLTVTYIGGALCNHKYTTFLQELELFNALCRLPKGME